MISSSSRIRRMTRTMLKPDTFATTPSTPNTKTAHVPQNVTISSPRLARVSDPNWATVKAMPPNAPIGAAHMTIRMIPKMIREAISKTPTTRVRRSSVSMEIAAAVTMARTRICRIVLSTNGCTKLVGSRSLVMKATNPESDPAEAIDSLALAALSAVGRALRPEPGWTMLPASSPRTSAMIVIARK